MPWSTKEEEYHQQLVNWKKTIGKNSSNGGNEKNNITNLIVSMQHLEEMVLDFLMSQEAHITLSRDNRKMRQTRECAELDME